jgi:hypothetical protein
MNFRLREKTADRKQWYVTLCAREDGFVSNERIQLFGKSINKGNKNLLTWH